MFWVGATVACANAAGLLFSLSKFSLHLSKLNWEKKMFCSQHHRTSDPVFHGDHTCLQGWVLYSTQSIIALEIGRASTAWCSCHVRQERNENATCPGSEDVSARAILADDECGRACWSEWRKGWTAVHATSKQLCVGPDHLEIKWQDVRMWKTNLIF